MLYLLYFFIPALISTEVYVSLNKNLDMYKKTKIYIFNLFFINTFTTAITVKFWNGNYNIQNYLLDCPGVGVKYSILALIFGIVFSFCISIIQKSFRLEMNIIEKEKNIKKISKNNK